MSDLMRVLHFTKWNGKIVVWVPMTWDRIPEMYSETSEQQNLECPICSADRPNIEHPQPFMDRAGRWLCGTCWFLHHTISVMRAEQKKEGDRR